MPSRKMRHRVQKPHETCHCVAGSRNAAPFQRCEKHMRNGIFVFFFYCIYFFILRIRIKCKRLKSTTNATWLRMFPRQM
ncbi:hypothetical protein M431DRAFT_358395 [Trichoderma harzianum CBS 226.95]|uniref:Uncharacterized protein n=1 Tax=Trichoderma harzianum CBS 226.95 TaxID=983964 RepID=A0A2T4ALZ3_TRIHA|nr:hypothetical protein M431DRAFT_358395 [Trichoderma harzianum CBS 226.95]PTB58097.1 hypothetical protein M431DRAFT_358395 [Trichoderma harzianum CBS 226.95]